MKQNQMLMLVVVAVIFGAGGFWGGKMYQQKQTPNFGGRMGGLNGQFGGRQGGGTGTLGRRIGGQTFGDILSIDDKTMTVKLTDGSSKIVLLSDTTSFNKEATGVKTDLKVGDKVGVFGQSNTDGSISAQMVQINPVMRQLSPIQTK